MFVGLALDSVGTCKRQSSFSIVMRQAKFNTHIEIFTVACQGDCMYVAVRGFTDSIAARIDEPGKKNDKNCSQLLCLLNVG